MPHRSRRPILAAGAALVLAAALGAPRSSAGEDDAGGGAAPGEMRAKVVVVTAAEGDLPVRVHALGTIIALPDRLSTVTSQVAGFVTKIEAADGDTVKAGAPLVRLDPRPFREALAKVEAAVKAAKAELDRAVTYSLDADQGEFDRAAAEARALVAPARKEADRQAGLLSAGLSSEKAVADARVAAEAADRAAAAAEAKSKAYREKGRAAEIARLEAAVAVADADVAPAERALASAVVTAPCDGRLSGLSVLLGRWVESGQILGQVTGPDAPALRLFLVPADAEAVAVGAAVTVAERCWTGSIRSIAGAVDSETGLVPVLASLMTCAPAPRIGESVLAEVDRGVPVHGILLPAAALEVRDDLPRVMVLDKDDLAHLVTVTLLARGSDRVLVSGEGLAAGARVVVDGNYNLPDGAHVVIGADEKASPPKKDSGEK